MKDSTLKMARLDEFVLRHKLPWPRTPTGRLSISNATFERIAEAHPEFSSLAEIATDTEALARIQARGGQ